ncbi:MFS family permease [Actinoplanes campanulatus]|uniref:MFS family permease n=1 Tax=Actinoplanes campanulatus TaxID=113559 RepID=A0A7W5AKF1_9ACTN|nr:MFS transporter [Actinoplanes campanulatus]MBB3097921.1 MFS family permease [Actinoplanes campanulatus]GGN22800.1 MFS transporter [Actinoplanes campanulatus]GID34610.1 MFS transporter [Actinoplanes campanulatus]
MAASLSSPLSSLRDKFGLPNMARHRNLASAALIDSLGTGMLLAFVVVYFAETTTLSLPAIGGAITIARFIAAPTAMVVGAMIDRFGTRRVALTGNLISAAGYIGFLAADSLWEVVAVTMLTQVGAVTYWTCSTGLVALAAEGTERTRWFAMLHTLRNVGLGAGGALGALLVGSGEDNLGLRLLVVANVISYLVAAFLLARWRPAEQKPETPASAAAERTETTSKYSTVLRDRRYMLLATINIVFVFAALVLSLLIGLYVIEALHEDPWIAGALLLLNSAQVALTQTVVSRWMERFRATRVIAVSCLVNAAAFGLFALLGMAPSWLVLAGLIAATVLYSIAETTATPLYENLSVALAPVESRGRYLAVYQLSWTFGQTAAPALLTFLLARESWLPWIFLAVLSVVAAPAVLVLERLINSRRPDQAAVAGAPV